MYFSSFMQNVLLDAALSGSRIVLNRRRHLVFPLNYNALCLRLFSLHLGA